MANGARSPLEKPGSSQFPFLSWLTLPKRAAKVSASQQKSRCHARNPSLRPAGVGLLAAVLASGRATIQAPPPPEPIGEVEPAAEPGGPEFAPVARYGRYTLAEPEPMAQQRAPLLQTIDVSMTEDSRATVGDGLRRALKRSGYRLFFPGMIETPMRSAGLSAES